MNTEKYIELIDEIKKRPALYDRNHIHFHDYHKKEHLWNWLSRKFNMNVKKKWGTLRDKFVRLKRESESNSDTNLIAEKWELYEPLSFLHNYCRHRKRPITTFKVDTPTPSDPRNYEFEFAIVSNNDYHNLSLDESQELSENNYIAETISNDSGDSVFDSKVEKIKTEIFRRNSKNNTTNDLTDSKSENLKLIEDTENMLFMKMIGKKLELLPNKDKNKIQIQILQLVNEELDKSEY